MLRNSIKKIIYNQSYLGFRSYQCFGVSKVDCGPLVYISGEEMTRYGMSLVMDQWIKPYVTTDNWQFYDLSCVNRDATDDKVLHDSVLAGQQIKAIFKEPTVTPTMIQKEKLGLKKSYPSPNGAMRRGWNGVTISRDTIHIEGMTLGYKKPVICDRHAVGGEYSAGWGQTGAGKLVTTFYPDDSNLKPDIVDYRTLTDNNNVAVVYHNPYDNIEQMAHIFFQRCADNDCVPYIVTKKTVFKWQEGFWLGMKKVFDEHYKQIFIDKGLINQNLRHLISDACTMQLVKWTKGGFGIACHNYDGDMLTDEVAMVHRSPGFLTSSLIGYSPEGTLIKQFEASHGTVADLWEQHLKGQDTSFNPLGMLTALISTMRHAALVNGKDEQAVYQFTDRLKHTVHKCMVAGFGTKDLQGSSGLTTEEFVDKVAFYMKTTVNHPELDIASVIKPIRKESRDGVKLVLDRARIKKLFQIYDFKKTGNLDLEEFTAMLQDLQLAPYIDDYEEQE